ncbi:hypothetical protein A7985_13645 [Pseudoalteromonas luteoviolacea]|uniref:WD40-like Beta Propeller Repeat n=1 Tax=Pseudoalteromonas luteoviolacea TaxID=43657 RepID=A0A1C0TPJ4_9GAMM|nr:PD40 domain-containing protein [Pseudoalteromonas luteoviolacea]OCQ20836.1 hypothetical protein A7985_13645 [Pseudoalteromonas luteoviolacea]
MKAVYLPTLLCTAHIAIANPPDSQSVLTGPYLGQPPVGVTAKPFAPGIVNTKQWGDAGGFSPDMNTFYLARWRHTADAKQPKSAIYENVNNVWHKTIMPEGFRKPIFSPDGKRKYFGAKYRELTANGWSDMKSLGPAFEKIPIMGLSASAKGTLVMDERTSDGQGVLRYSTLVNGIHQSPKPLSKTINTGKWNAHPFIAPDESYILWDSVRESGYGSSDLYISFRQDNGTWGKAINLGSKVNTPAEEGGPHITPDGKYLFFNRMVPDKNGKEGAQSDLFWIDAQLIEDLRPTRHPS